MTPKQAQWQLLFLDYYDGAIDGIWGPKSKAACSMFRTPKRTSLWKPKKPLWRNDNRWQTKRTD